MLFFNKSVQDKAWSKQLKNPIDICTTSRAI